MPSQMIYPFSFGDREQSDLLVEVRFDLTRSIPRKSNAAQIKPNPTTFPGDISSLNRNTPSKKKIVGVMY